MRIGAGDRSHRIAGFGIDGFDQSRLTDSDMDMTGGRVEEGYVGWPGNRPDIGDLSGAAVDLDEIAGIACGVETFARVIDVETVRAAGRKPPLRNGAQVGQAYDQNHGRFADTEEQPLRRSIGDAP